MKNANFDLMKFDLLIIPHKKCKHQTISIENIRFALKLGRESRAVLIVLGVEGYIFNKD